MKLGSKRSLMVLGVILILGGLAIWMTREPAEEKWTVEEEIPPQTAKSVPSSKVKTQAKVQAKTQANAQVKTQTKTKGKPAVPVKPAATGTASITSPNFRIEFALNADTLTALAKKQLQPAAAYLKSHPNVWVQIEGHTGTDEKDTIALGERRAQAAKKFFAQHGVVGDRCSTISYGSELPGKFKGDALRRVTFTLTSN